jgi:hypothetical protein
MVQADAKQQQDRQAWYTEAKPLLEAPDLLEQTGIAIQQRGDAGHVRPPKLAYVAIPSRLFERPQNCAFVALSAAGKHRAVDEAPAFVPPEAVYLIKAGSPRALIYNDECFSHRMIAVGLLALDHVIRHHQ